jgi:hypothetical protein
MADGNGNGNGAPKWGSFVPVIGVGSAIVGAMISFYVSSASLATQVSAQAARITSLETNYNIMAERELVLRTNNATMQAALIEIETQFCGEDDMRNLMNAAQERMLAIMWKKLNPDSEYPVANVYYPHVCTHMSSNPTVISR